MIVYDDLSPVALGSPSAVTIGKFDGLHRGHRKLLEALKEEKRKGLTAVVISFRIPDENGDPKPQIFTKGEFRSILAGFGVDVLISLTLTEEIRDMEAETFLRDILLGKLRMKTLVTGEFFSFGKGREGNLDYLCEASERLNFTLRSFRNIGMSRAGDFSSTAVRGLLAEGKVEEARNMLGRYYFVHGTVIHGHHIGSELGFPTLNVEPEEGKLYPKCGVYAVRVRIRGRWYEGMANLGLRPTVSDETNVLLEVNVFDFNENVYGCETTIYFRRMIREIRKFGSLSELSSQLAEDKKKIRELFEA